MREVVQSDALQTPEAHNSLERIAGVNSKVDSKATQSYIPVSISKVIEETKTPSSKYIAEPKNQPNSTTSLDLKAHKPIEKLNL